jgi:hypothetical protein
MSSQNFNLFTESSSLSNAIIRASSSNNIDADSPLSKEKRRRRLSRPPHQRAGKFWSLFRYFQRSKIIITKPYYRTRHHPDAPEETEIDNPFLPVYDVKACRYTYFPHHQMFKSIRDLPSTAAQAATILSEISDRDLIKKTDNVLCETHAFTHDARQSLAIVEDVMRDFKDSKIVDQFAATSKKLADSMDSVSDIVTRVKSYCTDMFSSFTGSSITDTLSSDIPTTLAKLTIHAFSFYRARDWLDRVICLLNIFSDFFLKQSLIQTLFTLFYDKMISLFSSKPPTQVTQETVATHQGAGNSEDTQGLYFLFTSILTLAGTVVAGKIPAKNYLGTAIKSFSNRMSEMSKIWNGIKSIKEIFKFCIDLCSQAVNYFMTVFFPVPTAMEILNKECDGIFEWSKRSYELGLEECMVQYAFNESLRDEVFALKDKGDEIRKKILHLKVPPTALTVFNQNYTTLIRLCEKVHKINLQVPFRIDPFCIWIQGKAGTSKSYSTMDIAHAIASDNDVPWYNRVYSRNLMEAFWSLYTGQFCVLLDDMGASRNNIKNDQWAEYIIMKSNNPFQVQMADVSEKGRQFSSKLMMINSNQMYPAPNDIECKDALWRRRNILAEFVTDLDPEQVQNLSGSMDHIKVNLHHPMKPGIILATLGYEQFVTFCRLSYKSYMERQSALVTKHLETTDRRKKLVVPYLGPSLLKAVLRSENLLKIEESQLPYAFLQNVTVDTYRAAGIETSERALHTLIHEVMANPNQPDTDALERPLLVQIDAELANRGVDEVDLVHQKFECLNSSDSLFIPYADALPKDAVKNFLNKVIAGYKPTDSFDDEHISLIAFYFTGFHLRCDRSRTEFLSFVRRFPKRPLIQTRNVVIGVNGPSRTVCIPKYYPDDYILYDTSMNYNWIETDLMDIAYIPPWITRKWIRTLIHADENCLNNVMADNAFRPATFTFFAYLRKLSPRLKNPSADFTQAFTDIERPPAIALCERTFKRTPLPYDDYLPIRIHFNMFDEFIAPVASHIKSVRFLHACASSEPMPNKSAECWNNHHASCDRCPEVFKDKKRDSAINVLQCLLKGRNFFDSNLGDSNYREFKVRYNMVDEMLRVSAFTFPLNMISKQIYEENSWQIKHQALTVDEDGNEYYDAPSVEFGFNPWESFSSAGTLNQLSIPEVQDMLTVKFYLDPTPKYNTRAVYSLVSHWTAALTRQYSSLTNVEARKQIADWCQTFIDHHNKVEPPPEFLDAVMCIDNCLSSYQIDYFSLVLAQDIVKHITTPFVPLQYHVTFWTRMKREWEASCNLFRKSQPHIYRILIALGVIGAAVGAFSMFSNFLSKPDPEVDRFGELDPIGNAYVRTVRYFNPNFKSIIDNTGKDKEQALRAVNVAHALARKDSPLEYVIDDSGEIVYRTPEPQKYSAGTRQSALKAVRTVKPKAQTFSKPSFQSSDAQVDSIIQNKLRRAVFRIARVEGKSVLQMNAIAIKGQILIIPFHFFYSIKPHTHFSLISHQNVEFVEEFLPEKLIRMGEGDNRTDIAFYQMSAQFPPQADITSKFITEGVLQLFDERDATYFGMNSQLQHFCFSGRAKAIDHIHNSADQFQLKDPTDASGWYQHRKGWKMSALTPDGYCGSPLLAHNINLPGIIMGIHSAYLKSSSTAISCLITYENVIEALTHFAPQYQIADLFLDSPEFQALCIEKDIICEDLSHTNISHEGKFKLGIRLATHTRIRPSPIQGIFPFAPVTEPAALHNEDPRLEPEIRGKNLLAMQLEKYGNIVKPFPVNDIRRVKENILDTVLNYQTDRKPKVLSIDEAINGLPLDFFDRMDMSTSPGYPYVKERKAHEKGKSFLFENIGSEFEPHYTIKSQTLKHNLTRRLEAARRGEMVFSLWTNCLKDERRKKLRVKQGNTRTFCAAPVDLTIMVRMFFLDFCAAVMKNRVNHFSAVGINVDGPEWTSLYNRLKSVGNYGFDGDFKNFDGTLHSEIIWEICDIVNSFYNDGPVNALVRFVIVAEIIHTRSQISMTLGRILDEFIIRKHIGEPSGVPLTSIFNTFGEAFYTRLAWLDVTRGHSLPKALFSDYPSPSEHSWNTPQRSTRIELSTMTAFDRFVKDNGYGDDNINACHDAILKIFNRVTVSNYLKQYGITYTDASKTGNLKPYDPIDNLTFLKRGFIPHPKEPSLMLAPIDVNSINELCNWVTHSEDPRSQLQMNLYDALRFAHSYGNKYYTSLKDILRTSLKEIDYNISLPSYTEFDEEWLNQWNEKFEQPTTPVSCFPGIASCLKKYEATD